MARTKEKWVRVHTTSPHAAQDIMRVDDPGDDYKPDDQIFVIQDTYDRKKWVGFTGLEIANIAKWWAEYCYCAAKAKSAAEMRRTIEGDAHAKK
jgi:hypothetical protein